MKPKAKVKGAKRAKVGNTYPPCPNCSSHSIYYKMRAEKWHCKRCGLEYSKEARKGGKKQ